MAREGLLFTQSNRVILDGIFKKEAWASLAEVERVNLKMVIKCWKSKEIWGQGEAEYKTGTQVSKVRPGLLDVGDDFISLDGLRLCSQLLVTQLHGLTLSSHLTVLCDFWHTAYIWEPDPIERQSCDKRTRQKPQGSCNNIYFFHLQIQTHFWEAQFVPKALISEFS